MSSHPMPSEMPAFPGRLVRVVDGDTLRVELHATIALFPIVVRLARVNAPERGTPAGEAATAWVSDWLAAATVGHADDWPLRVQVLRPDNYGGRWDSEVWRRSDGANLADALLAAGQAVPWPAPAGTKTEGSNAAQQSQSVNLG